MDQVVAELINNTALLFVFVVFGGLFVLEFLAFIMEILDDYFKKI